MAKKILSFAVMMLILGGCATQRKAKEGPSTPIPSGPQDSGPVTESEPESEPEEPPAPVVSEPTPVRVVPKIGIIFSGGGAKAWAHIGVLKEIEKAKWPIHSVGGFEWGAAVAGVYAHQLSSNEVEWELSKVKGFENPQQNSDVVFERKAVSDLKIPFVCSSLNVAKQTVYMLNRGQLAKLMPFCLAQPPLSKPYSQSVAEMDDIAGLASHLRATGANKIVLINVLAQRTKRSFTEEYLSAENILWVKSAAIMAKRIPGVDDVVTVRLDDYGISDLGKRREIIAKGSELGYTEIKRLTSKYGL